MRTVLVCCVVGLCAFFAGRFLSGRSLEPAGLETSRSNGTDSLLEGEMRARLECIEAALAEPRVSDSSSPSVREPASDADGVEIRDERLRALEEKIDRILARAEAASMGLGEISMSRPTPDQESLTKLFEASAKDPSMLSRAIGGMTYRDVILAYGTPTKKKDHPDRTFAGMPVTYWYWSIASQSRVLLISFADGTARHAAFMGASVLEDE